MFPNVLLHFPDAASPSSSLGISLFDACTMYTPLPKDLHLFPRSGNVTFDSAKTKEGAGPSGVKAPYVGGKVASTSLLQCNYKMPMLECLNDAGAHTSPLSHTNPLLPRWR